MSTNRARMGGEPRRVLCCDSCQRGRTRELERGEGVFNVAQLAGAVLALGAFRALGPSLVEAAPDLLVPHSAEEADAAPLPPTG
jgi:hypothetical protein